MQFCFVVFQRNPVICWIVFHPKLKIYNQLRIKYTNIPSMKKWNLLELIDIFCINVTIFYIFNNKWFILCLFNVRKTEIINMHTRWIMRCFDLNVDKHTWTHIHIYTHTLLVGLYDMALKIIQSFQMLFFQHTYVWSSTFHIYHTIFVFFKKSYFAFKKSVFL